MDAWWRAANYLSIGQTYLYDNPLLKKPLKIGAHKTSPGRSLGHDASLNFIYVHLNRLIKQRDLNMIYIIGPGTAGPASSPTPGSKALQRDLSEHAARRRSMKKLFKQFSFPGGIPVMSRPNARFDSRRRRIGLRAESCLRRGVRQSGLIVATVVAMARPRPGRWQLVALKQVPQSATDGAVLRFSTSTVTKLPIPPYWPASATRNWINFSALRLHAHLRRRQRTDDDASAHGRRARSGRRRNSTRQNKARGNGSVERPRWPMIILRFQRAGLAPKEIDGKRAEGFWRSPGADGRNA